MVLANSRGLNPNNWINIDHHILFKFNRLRLFFRFNLNDIESSTHPIPRSALTVPWFLSTNMCIPIILEGVSLLLLRALSVYISPLFNIPTVLIQQTQTYKHTGFWFVHFNNNEKKYLLCAFCFGLIVCFFSV